MIDSFSGQFEPDGDGYLYRKALKAAPIRLTTQERDSFVADYRRSLRISYWSMMATMLIASGMMVAWFIYYNGEPSSWSIYMGIAVITLAYVAINIRSYYAPARALERRVPVGVERSRAEVRVAALKRMTYGQLAGSAALFPIALLNVSRRTDLMNGWGRLWLVAVVVLELLVVWTAFKKWRIESGGQ